MRDYLRPRMWKWVNRESTPFPMYVVYNSKTSGETGTAPTLRKWDPKPWCCSGWTSGRARVPDPFGMEHSELLPLVQMPRHKSSLAVVFSFLFFFLLLTPLFLRVGGGFYIYFLEGTPGFTMYAISLSLFFWLSLFVYGDADINGALLDPLRGGGKLVIQFCTTKPFTTWRRSFLASLIWKLDRSSSAAANLGKLA